MDKIASPRDLEKELRGILAYSETAKPSRERIAAKLSELADRIGGGYVLGPGGLEKPQGTNLTLQVGAMYFLGASSSPKMVILTGVTDDMIKYKEYPFDGADRSIQRWIGADLLAKGTTTALKNRSWLDPGLKSSLTSLLRGGKGRKEKMDDYHRMKVLLAPADDMVGQDLWRQAEEYGNVGGIEIDGIEHYEVTTEKREVEKMKNDRRFKVVKVKKAAMDYNYNRTAAHQRTAFGSGPAGKVLGKWWNEMHDLERELEDLVHEYDQAASYRGAPGERDAKQLMRLIQNAIKAVQALSDPGGAFDKLLDAENFFVKKHGTPEDYRKKTQHDFGFR